jgi:hypothetical protein
MIGDKYGRNEETFAKKVFMWLQKQTFKGKIILKYDNTKISISDVKDVLPGDILISPKKVLINIDTLDTLF